MKVLILSPYLPYPGASHGTAVFMYGLLGHLAARHEITLLSFCDDEEARHVDELRALPLTLHTVARARGRQQTLAGNFLLGFDRLVRLCRSLVFWTPYYVEKYRSRSMRHMVRRLTRDNRFDIIQMEFAYMAQYVADVQQGKTLLHEHDVSYRPTYRRYRHTRAGMNKIVYFLEWCRWARYEPAAGKRCNGIMTVTEQDRQLMEYLTGGSRVYYFPRGVDMARSVTPASGRESHSLLFIGTFRHHPNVDAAEWLLGSILPRILQRFPDTVTHILGADPPASILGRANACPGVTIHGFVRSAEEYLDRCAVFVAPLRFGGGVKIKLIHAFARGIPVVTTKTGIEGIPASGRQPALTGRTEGELADAICRLFADSALADRVGAAGYALAREQYAWDATTDTLERIYRSVAAG